MQEGLLGPILDQLRAAGLAVGTAYELKQPERIDCTFTDHDGHRVTLFELHQKKSNKWVEPN